MCQLWKIICCKCQCLRVTAVAWTFVCAQIEPRCFTRRNGHVSAQGAPWTSDSNVKKAEQTNHNLAACEAARYFTGYAKDMTKLPRTTSPLCLGSSSRFDLAHEGRREISGILSRFPFLLTNIKDQGNGALVFSKWHSTNTCCLLLRISQILDSAVTSWRHPVWQLQRKIQGRLFKTTLNS